jgi:molybdopterin synthase catalytic subunit
MLATVRLQTGDFDAAAESAALSRGRVDVGALVTFMGICRGADDGRALVAMTLEHYPGMAQAEIERHVEEAQQRWPLLGVTVIHRYGRLVPGDNIVLVVTAASHRAPAFEAAEFIMDYLKTRAPFWKMEEWADGEAEGRTWVEAKAIDDAAVERWHGPRGGGAAE